MLVFSTSGRAGFNGEWSTITSAKSLNANLLNVPGDATHWVRYKTGSVAELQVGELLTGGTSSATARLVAVASEGGTAAGSNEYGILILKTVSGTPTAAGETWTGGTSTGTVVTVIAPIVLKFFGQPKSLLVSVETAAVNINFNGVTAAVTGNLSGSHQITAGGSYLITDWENVRDFSCINAVNANGAVVKYTLFF